MYGDNRLCRYRYGKEHIIMTYEEIVKKAKQAAKNIDSSAIKDHVAIQIDIEGEGEGAFYIEAADGKATVEPYEYYEHDCKIKTDADTITALLSGKLDAEGAMAEGKLQVEGDGSKALALIKAVKKPAAKKATAEKPAAKKAAAKKPAAKKTTAAKKPAAKKTTAAKSAGTKKA